MKPVTERELKIATLEAGFRSRGDPIRIRELSGQSMTGSSSFATERLRARMDDGRILDVFFKDLDPAHQLAEAKQIREPGLEPSRREHWTYTEVLSSSAYGTPELYASCWDEPSGHLWLFLEFVGPKRLSRLGDFQLWVEAARWAAGFHAATRDTRHGSNPVLRRFDGARYAESRDRLERNIDRFRREDRPVLENALTSLRDAIERVCSLPRCLVHGEFFGKNVVIRPNGSGARIAVVDWETTAFGPGCVDLVSICAGRWSLEQREVMWRAYFQERQRSAVSCPDWPQFRREIEDVALCQAILWIAYWSGGDDVHIDRWMRELRAVLSLRRPD